MPMPAAGVFGVWHFISGSEVVLFNTRILMYCSASDKAGGLNPLHRRRNVLSSYRRCWTRNLHRWHRCHCCHRRCLTGDQLSRHLSSLMQIWASPVVGWFRPTSSRSRKCWPDTWASPGCHEASRSGWNSGETTVPVFGCHQQRGETTVSRLRWPAKRGLIYNKATCMFLFRYIRM